MAEPPVVEVTPARFSEIAARVAHIDEDARAADGHPALGDAVWLDLEHPGPDSAGFLVDDRAYAHVARNDNGARANWTLGLALGAAARTGGARHALVAAALRHVAARRGGRVTLWVLGAQPDDDTDLAAAGFQPARELYEMRVALPLSREPKWPAGVTVRPFEIGRDESSWLEVNNRAFAGHAEQGGWTTATLARRMSEPWFDPALFLLAVDAEGIAGFNWLKIHDAHDHDPRLGEIYVIAVDPRAQGSGLGGALATAGLRAVHEHGIDTGMLFCAADNEPGLRLYRNLGFDVHRTDRAYECEVAPE
jgi:mycothiol synthase